jgi:uncharacterized lipoprotein YddW (UPF0748 family)
MPKLLSGPSVRRAWCACPLVALALCAGSAVAAPISVTEINRKIQGRDVRGFVAVVDLSDPAVDIVVTPAPPAGSPGDSVLTRTDTWMAGYANMHLAVNANFFGVLSGSNADIVGLSLSDGVQVSPPRQYFSEPWDPALVIDEDARTARAGRFGPADIAGAEEGVAGVGPSNTDADPGTMLVEDGVNVGATARVQPSVRNPRTAAGVSQDGGTLILMVIDGRQTGWSDGVTLPQLADLMIEFGAYDAINLDGGGSSSFIFDDGTVQRENRPSDGQHRAVANHIGVIVTPPPTGPQNNPPLRGAWLRPPTDLNALTTTVQLLQQAGVRDLFLETFYHGLATNDSAVFNDRFTFDYLAEAVKIAGRYGLRTHAWLETGYWGLSGSADYVLNANPEWKVVDVNGVTNIGDQASQVFVNLGHPGVQGMLRDYVEELSGYPGLWGVHIDYHRFPLDNNTGDVFTAPYSYDVWSRTQFINQTLLDPLIYAKKPGDPAWTQFVQWRRDSISGAVTQMNLGIDSVRSDIEFSGAVFPTAVTSSAQLVKMQDWPSWAADGDIETIIPMCYSTSTSGIQSELSAAKSQIGPAKLAAGLAILTNITRPTITQQLTVAKNLAVTDFVLFDAPTLVATQARRDELYAFCRNQLPLQTGDLTLDLSVDARDLFYFANIYQGAPVAVNGFNQIADVDGSGLIDAQDEAILRDQFSRYRFGPNGVVDQADLDALLNAWTGPGPTNGQLVFFGPIDLFDLDGDADVDYADQVVLHSFLTVALPPDLDVNADSEVDIEDLYAQTAGPRDVNRSGAIDAADAADLEAFLRQGEAEDMVGGQRP